MNHELFKWVFPVQLCTPIFSSLYRLYLKKLSQEKERKKWTNRGGILGTQKALLH